jgi:predicted secreted protein
MKKIKNYLLLIAFFAFALFLPAKIYAGDYAALNFIGFSKDGKYLAFEEYGTHDGSGFPYATIYFINVEKNSYAAAPVRKMFDEKSMKVFDESKIPGEDVMRASAMKAAAANLKKFKIVQGNTGKMLVARLLTDLNAENVEPGDENTNQTVKFTDERMSSYYEKEYELLLKTSEVKLKTCDYVYYPVLKFDLTLKDVKSETEKILQKDNALPESRGCPHAYSIQNVYAYENRIAVFINVYTTGFEGPDMRYMVVTGNYR